jgi:K+-sensing histidine kinase KdpD
MNLKLREIIQMLKDVAESQETDVDVIKDFLQEVVTESLECLSVNDSSTKLLNYFVNDILSFAQISGGKFRKDVSTFNIKEAIQEVISIQRFKFE